MEFWGVEVKAGETLKVKPETDSVIHLSQAAIGETKKDKGNDSIVLYVKFGDQKLVLGTLSSEKFPQLCFDVVFEKEFELSHNWKNGSLYLCGYQSPMPVDDDNELYESSDEDDEIPMLTAENGKPETKTKPEPIKTNAKPEKHDSEEDSDEEGDDSDEEGAEDMSEDDDEEDSEDEETPKKGGKRTKESGKSPQQGKKAKIVTPQKTDGKKGNVHTATPYPAKKGAAAGPNKQTPAKSATHFSCKSCDRAFNSDVALQSHSKAKHNK